MKSRMRMFSDALVFFCLVVIATGAICTVASLARDRRDIEADRAALARPVRPPVPGEYRGLTVPQVVDEMNRRGGNNNVSPADVLTPEY